MKRKPWCLAWGWFPLRQICDQLMAHGRKGDTPIALVSRGTTNLQEVITGTLETLPDDIEGREIHAPTLIIVAVCEFASEVWVVQKEQLIVNSE